MTGHICLRGLSRTVAKSAAIQTGAFMRPPWRDSVNKKWQWAAVAALVASSPVMAAKQHVCIFDILGTGGDGYNSAKDYAIEMQKFGTDMELKAYVDERVAVEDFRTGQCDAVMATALRTRAFNALTAALDSVGASTVVRNGKLDMNASLEVVRKTIQTFSSPNAAPRGTMPPTS